MQNWDDPIAKFRGGSDSGAQAMLATEALAAVERAEMAVQTSVMETPAVAPVPAAVPTAPALPDTGPGADADADDAHGTTGLEELEFGARRLARRAGKIAVLRHARNGLVVAEFGQVVGERQ